MSEKTEARRDNAKLQKNSGRSRTASQKGDAQSDYFVIDYKEVARSFTLNLAVWAKVCSDAAKVDINKLPVLRIIIGAGKQKLRLAIVQNEVIEDYERLRRLETDGTI